MKLDHWQQHEPILLAFEAAWEAGTEPNPCSFAQQADDAGRTQLLAELVMIDFEHRSRRTIAVSLDDYLNQHPELKLDQQILQELVQHEFRLRHKLGTFPTAAEIDSRFKDDSTAKDIWHRISESNNVPKLQVAHIPSGTMIGSYVISKVIGTGAFATVYLAVDSALNRQVAIKIMMQSSDTRPEIRLRMQREAKAIASVNHPCIVPIYENGSYLDHDYIVTRFVDGITLERQLRKTELTTVAAVELIQQLASALETVHDLGVIHRDIKPANIMLENQTAQLVDFGLAALDNASQLLTHEGDIVGTPAYMPPEQASGHAIKADGRSDIYSLGATLYRLVCGRLPFEGTTSEVISKVLKVRPTIAPDVCLRIGKDLTTIILKCLEKAPSDRYQTAALLAADLTRFQAGQPIHARPIGRLQKAAQWVRTRPAVTILAGAAVVSIGFLMHQHGQLREVVVQRDSAQRSDRATKLQLQHSTTEAGILALQRGQIDTAITYLQQSLNSDSESRFEILLMLVQANLRNADVKSAQQWWHKANNDFDSQHDATKHSPFGEGLLLLWQGEISRAEKQIRGPETRQAEDIFREARLRNLPIPEQHYVDGLLAHTTIDALPHLEAAIATDPLHDRARLTLIATQLSLAMIEEGTANLHVARQFNPESVDFILLEEIANALQPDADMLENRLRKTHLSSEQRQAWNGLYRMIRAVVIDPRYANGMAGFDQREFISVVERLGQAFDSVHQPRPWNLPFVTEAECWTLQHELPNCLKSDPQAGIELLESMVQIHPESSLLLALGSLRLAQCSGLPENSATEIEWLEKAAFNYRMAVSRPGFLKHDDQIAWKAIFTISTVLANIMQHDVDNNVNQLLEATRKVDEESIVTASQARTFTILNLTHNNITEADRWGNRWQQLTTPSDSLHQDALWHKAVIAKRLENWVDVIKWCDAISKTEPDAPHVKALKEFAMTQLRQVLQDE
ncbi:MAG: serine/threonine-protein kinase [Fuerstiella sp.]